MHPLIDEFFPRNKIQRIGLFVAIVLVILVVFLHNPLDGYDTAHYVDFTDGEFKDGPFWKWRSMNPIVYWFGAMTHLAAAIAATWVLCATWLYLFRNN